MNPIDQLKAVLCDPSGKCCIDGSDEDRAIIDRALQALAQPEQELVTNSDLYSTAGRLALELECLLLDTKDISIVSKWWDSAHEALDQWRKFHFRACTALDSATRSADSAETFGKPEQELDYPPECTTPELGVAR